MDRRKLLKLFGIGAAASVAAPVLAKIPIEREVASIKYGRGPGSDAAEQYLRDIRTVLDGPQMSATEVLALANIVIERRSDMPGGKMWQMSTTWNVGSTPWLASDIFDWYPTEAQQSWFKELVLHQVRKSIHRALA